MNLIVGPCGVTSCVSEMSERGDGAKPDPTWPITDDITSMRGVNLKPNTKVRSTLCISDYPLCASNGLCMETFFEIFQG
jgi:hypothetical protein